MTPLEAAPYGHASGTAPTPTDTVWPAEPVLQVRGDLVDLVLRCFMDIKRGSVEQQGVLGAAGSSPAGESLQLKVASGPHV